MLNGGLPCLVGICLRILETRYRGLSWLGKVREGYVRLSVRGEPVGAEEEEEEPDGPGPAV